MSVLSGPGSGIPIVCDKNRDKARSEGIFPWMFSGITKPLVGLETMGDRVKTFMEISPPNALCRDFRRGL